MVRNFSRDQGEARYRIREILERLELAEADIDALEALIAGLTFDCTLGDHVHMDCGNAANDLVDIDCGNPTDDVEIECGSIV